jgi:hypothetical protein
VLTKLQSFLKDKARYRPCFAKRDVGRRRLASALEPQARSRIR